MQKPFLLSFALALIAMSLHAQSPTKHGTTFKFPASTLMGDVNGDGTVTITDVTMMVGYILGESSSEFIAANADVNHDGSITITDVTQTISIILGNNSDDDAQTFLDCPDNHHPHIIDLGLPSGTKWACCNIGAATPEDFGGYYAWGETEEKEEYEWRNYLLHYTDNNSQGSYAFTFGTGESSYWHFLNIEDISGTEYDVAHMKWGGRWQMPTEAQFNELIDHCSKTWKNRNGTSGKEFNSRKGGRLFLPDASKSDETTSLASHGYYWSSTQYADDKSIFSKAYMLSTSINKVIVDKDKKFNGIPVRPVWTEGD